MYEVVLFSCRRLMLRATVMLLAFGALALSTESSSAGDRYHYRGYYGGFYAGNGAAVAGAVGLAAGAILGAALATPRYYGPPAYYAPPRHAFTRRIHPRHYNGAGYPYQLPSSYPRRSRAYVLPSTPVFETTFSPEWIAYCARKYRSFNPRTGTYLAYSGKVRMCR